METLRHAIQLAEEGLDLALATVIVASGSTPRHPGAHMLVLADGSIFGTIGGGRIEQVTIEAAVSVIASGIPRTLSHHLVRDLGMCCGGSMELYIEPVAPSLTALRVAVELLERREPGLLVTQLGGGNKVVELVASVDGLVPHCDEGRFVEPLRAADRLIVFGNGHVSRAVAPLATTVGFQVCLCDDNETGAVDHEPGWAARVCHSFEAVDLENCFGPFGVGDYLLIVTRDHALDQRILQAHIGNSKVSYLGMIGSRGKAARFRKRILARQEATEADWARLRSPVGAAIGAETPEEIAVSIVAELIAVRNQGRR